MISFQRVLAKASTINRKTWIWVVLGLIALPTLRIYYVQEMLAALIGFSVLFGAIFAAVFAVYVLTRASEPVMIWAGPKIGRAVQRSVEAAEDVVAYPEWAKAVPVWAKAVPHHFRRQQVRLNENYKVVCSRFGRLGLRPAHVYRTSLQKGGAALTLGLRTPRRLSSQLGNWLRQPVRYPDFIRLVRISRLRFSVRARQPRRRR